MANTLEYILSLKDQMSSNLSRIGVSSDSALSKFSKLEKQASETSKLMRDMGTSSGTLKAKLDLLRSEKEWIPASNIKTIQTYNREIQNLEQQISNLDTQGLTSFKTKLKDSLSQIPGIGLVTNPIVALSGALFASGKMAFGFEEGMAKINTTAQLTQPQLAKLKQELIEMGTDTGTDLATIPEAYEKIISQTGDVALSTDIMKASLKGAKAGFGDVATIAAAVSNSLSLVGPEVTNAQEMLDTFFAAKRVGAGEMEDFAKYMPGLISSGQALGMNFKDVAGTFAYMTGKGQSAERAAVLMENAYSAMGKVDIQNKLKDAGINIFDESGSLMQIDQIFGALSSKMEGMSDEAKSAFLAKMGLVDKEAKSAFLIMASDTGKLAESLGDVQNAAGETDEAFKLSMNPMQKLAMLWAKIQKIGLALGGVLSTVLVPVIDVLATTVGWLTDGFGWFFDKLREGNPLLWGLVAVIGVMTITSTASAIAVGAVSAATWLWTGAQWALNLALSMNPISLIIIAIIALIAVIAYIIMQTEGWGKLWENIVGMFQSYWKMTCNIFQLEWLAFEHVFLTGINLIQKAWYKLKGLWDKDGAAEGLAKIQKQQDARSKGLSDKKREIIGNASDIGKYASGAVNSLSWKGTSMADVKKDIGSKLGLTSAEDKVNAHTDLANGKGNKDGKGKGTAGSKSNEAIATGGTKNTVINMTFKNIIETIAVSGRDFNESAQQMQDQSADAVLRALAMATTTAG